jgi:hypothetical protein
MVVLRVWELGIEIIEGGVACLVGWLVMVVYGCFCFGASIFLGGGES